jgi:sugar-specific transcriptional regulator TrmB
MIEENLKKLGFTHNEVKIYLTLLRVGKLKAGELIKETGLQRSVVYNDLDELLQRGLVSKSIIKGVAVYASTDPEALAHEAEQKAFLAKKISEELKQKQRIKDREVVVYEGEGIVKRVADKSLDSPMGSTIYFLGPSKFGIQANLEKYWQQYHKKRYEKGVNCRILYDKSTDPRVLQNRNALPLCEAQYLPIEMEMPMSFIISDDIVGMVVPSENPPLAFLIKSPKTAEALKNYFEYLWGQGASVRV